MDIIQSLNLATAGELALASFLIGIVVKLIKSTGKISTNLLPLVSIVMGLVIGVVSAIVTNDTNYVSAAVCGGVLGAATSGLVDLGSGAVSTYNDAKTKKVDNFNTAVQQAVAQQIQKSASSETQSEAISANTDKGVVENVPESTPQNK